MRSLICHPSVYHRRFALETTVFASLATKWFCCGGNGLIVAANSAVSVSKAKDCSLCEKQMNELTFFAKSITMPSMQTGKPMIGISSISLQKSIQSSPSLTKEKCRLIYKKAKPNYSNRHGSWCDDARTRKVRKTTKAIMTSQQHLVFHFRVSYRRWWRVIGTVFLLWLFLRRKMPLFVFPIAPFHPSRTTNDLSVRNLYPFAILLSICKK